MGNLLRFLGIFKQFSIPQVRNSEIVSSLCQLWNCLIPSEMHLLSFAGYFLQKLIGKVQKMAKEFFKKCLRVNVHL